MTSKKRITIQDVAAQAAVSTATVSAVINQSKYVSPALTTRVEAAIDDLGYRPSLLARSLKMRETKTLALIFTNTTSPIWPPLVKTAEQVAQAAGYDVFLVTTDESIDRERSALQSLIAKGVDGILITPAVADSYAHIQQAAAAVPLIAIERRVPNVECVVTDNETVSYQAVRYLQSQHCQRIGLLTIPVLGSNIAERIAGYQKAQRESGDMGPYPIRTTAFDGSTAQTDAMHLLTDAGVDAIFATSQSSTLGAWRAANTLGLRIPQDLALVGYDEAPWMTVVSPPIPTIQQPVEDIATLATQRLLARLDGREIGDEVHTIHSTLNLRNTPLGGNQ